MKDSLRRSLEWRKTCFYALGGRFQSEAVSDVQVRNLQVLPVCKIDGGQEIIEFRYMTVPTVKFRMRESSVFDVVATRSR